MERTKQIMYILVLELISSIYLVTKTHPFPLIGLFIGNALLLAYLYYEPYWKIGGKLILLVFLQINLFLLNKVWFNFLIKSHCILNLITIIFGFIVVLIAHKMKINERGYLDNITNYDYSENNDNDETNNEFEEKNDLNDDNYSDELDIDSEETQKDESKEKKSVNNDSYILDSKEKLHKENCEKIIGETKVIGSKKYALHKGYTPCKICKPFS